MKKFLLNILGVKEAPKTSIVAYVVNGKRVIGISSDGKERIFAMIEHFVDSNGNVTKKTRVQEDLFFENAIRFDDVTLKDILLDEVRNMSEEEVSKVINYIALGINIDTPRGLNECDGTGE